MSPSSPRIRRDLVVGSRRISNYVWAVLLTLGGIGFLATGLSSRLQTNLLPFVDYQAIQFFPQGLVRCFYGAVALTLAVYLWSCIAWSVGGGFNEFDREQGRVRIFRWGYPGRNRRIELVYPLSEVDAVRVELQEGLNPQRAIYLRLKGNRDLLLTRIGQPRTLEELERQAADLARFLQVGLEGLSSFFWLSCSMVTPRRPSSSGKYPRFVGFPGSRLSSSTSSTETRTTRPVWDPVGRAYRNLERILRSLDALETSARRYQQDQVEAPLYRPFTDLLASRWFELWISSRLARWDARLGFTREKFLIGLGVRPSENRAASVELLALLTEAEEQVEAFGLQLRIRPYEEDVPLADLAQRTKRNARERSFSQRSGSSLLGGGSNLLLPGYEPLGARPSSIPKTILRFVQGLSPAYEDAAVERYRLGRYQFLASARAALGLRAAPILASEIGKRWCFQPLVRYAWNTYHSGAFLSEAQQRLALHELRGFEEALYFEERLSHLPNAEVFIGDRARELQIPGQQEAILHQRRREVLERYNDESIASLVTLAGDVTLLVGVVIALFRLRYEIIILRGVLTELFFALDDPLKCFWLYYSAELVVGYHSKNGWDVGLRAARRRIGLEENEQVIKLAIATVPVRIDTVFKYWVFRHLNRLSPTTTATYYQLIESPWLGPSSRKGRRDRLMNR